MQSFPRLRLFLCVAVPYAEVERGRSGLRHDGFTGAQVAHLHQHDTDASESRSENETQSTTGASYDTTTEVSEISSVFETPLTNDRFLNNLVAVNHTDTDLGGGSIETDLTNEASQDIDRRDTTISNTLISDPQLTILS